MQGKTVIVTGGGRGIGKAVCRRFAVEGANVLAVARSREELGETRRLIRDEGGICETATADVGVAAQVRQVIDHAVGEFGGVDVLINNAGMARCAPVEELEFEVFDQMVAVNVTAVYYACVGVWPIMRQRGGGIIVNLSSRAAVDPLPGFAAYGASKTFVEALTRNLAAEGAKHNIRVYAVGPGAVDTRMLRGPFPDFPDDQCLQPEEVAELVWTVTQPVCQHSSGQTIYISKSG